MSSDELRAAGLDVEERESVVEKVWTCDSIIGFMFSTSIASRRVLGDNASNFEADLRRALLEGRELLEVARQRVTFLDKRTSRATHAVGFVGVREQIFDRPA